MSDPFPISASLENSAEIAALHVASWRETYPGLLPEAEIARHDEVARQALWTAVLHQGKTRISLLPGIGFAAMGPQRDPHLSADWPEELVALYVMRGHQGRGIGRLLLRHVLARAPFTAWVLAGNTRAEGFYAAMGGREIRRASEQVGGMTVTDILLSFPNPAGNP